MGCASSRIDRALETIYRLKAEVGDGAEATVWLGRAQASQANCALKLIKTAHKVSVEIDGVNRNLLNEAQSRARLGRHVNIIRFDEVVLTEQHVVLVMEWVGGGTLSKYCRKRPFLPEEDALYFFKQMVSAVEFCHANHLAHRDVKLENCLLDTSTSPPRLKLADFGLAKAWEPGSNKLCRMQTVAGTPGYISPEVVGTMLGAPGASYDGRGSDVWSLGVALATLLLHHKPYAYSELQHLSVMALLSSMHHQQLYTRWADSSPIRDNLHGISTSVRDLLSRIFVSDASQRISLEGIREHPWFQQKLSRSYQAQLDSMAAEQAHNAACVPPPASLSELQERLLELQQRLEGGGVPPGALERVSFNLDSRPAISDSTQAASSATSCKQAAPLATSCKQAAPSATSCKQAAPSATSCKQAAPLATSCKQAAAPAVRTHIFADKAASGQL